MQPWSVARPQQCDMQRIGSPAGLRAQVLLSSASSPAVTLPAIGAAGTPAAPTPDPTPTSRRTALTPNPTVTAAAAIVATRGSIRRPRPLRVAVLEHGDPRSAANVVQCLLHSCWHECLQERAAKVAAAGDAGVKPGTGVGGGSEQRLGSTRAAMPATATRAGGMHANNVSLRRGRCTARDGGGRSRGGGGTSANSTCSGGHRCLVQAATVSAADIAAGALVHFEDDSGASTDVQPQQQQQQQPPQPQQRRRRPKGRPRGGRGLHRDSCGSCPGELQLQGAAWLRRGVDVLLVPGGKGLLQLRDLGEGGRAAIRAFVARGGGYVGICAGAYLATTHWRATDGECEPGESPDRNDILRDRHFSLECSTDGNGDANANVHTNGDVKSSSAPGTPMQPVRARAVRPLGLLRAAVAENDRVPFRRRSDGLPTRGWRWLRGNGHTRVRFSMVGRSVLWQEQGRTWALESSEVSKDTVVLRYNNGPVFVAQPPQQQPPHPQRDDDHPCADELPEFEALAFFDSEVSDAKFKAREGSMLHQPAIVSSMFGRGRVLLISPHPESTHADPSTQAPAGIARLRRIVQRAVTWAGGR